MKHLKKIMALVIAMVMMVAMVVPAMADTIVTITPATGDTGTHSYGAYQIFAGDVSTGEKLSNVVWGSGINSSNLNDTVKTAIKAALGKSEDNTFNAGDAKSVAEALTETNAAAFADAIAAALGSAEKTGASEITGLAGGYYLIQDDAKPTTTAEQKAAKTKYILQVLPGSRTTIQAKTSVPSVEKKVSDVNDSTGTTGTGDSADHDLNDIFTFTITATLGDGIQNFKQYYLQFKDTMSNGLEFQSVSSIKLYADGDTTKEGVDVSAGFTKGTDVSTTIKSATNTDLTATTRTWTTNDLFAITGVTKTALSSTTKIVLTYTAKLTASAAMGKPGNPNEVSLVYTSNPNFEGNGTPDTEETPKDRNVVFTYEIEADKISDATQNTPLEGANFALYKLYTADTIGTRTEAGDINYDNGTKTYTKVSGEKWVLVKEITVTGSTFEFDHVDDGEYLLVETKTPVGYNSVKPSRFKVEATHTDNTANPQLTALTGQDDKGSEDLQTITLQADANLSELNTKILNQSGATLPSTGGIGTTIFYVIGAILVLGAGILLVTRRRVSAN